MSNQYNDYTTSFKDKLRKPYMNEREKLTKAKNQKHADKIMQILSKSISEPKTELEYKDPYTLLVAVILSARTLDKTVNRITERLFQIADSPQKMVELGENELKEHIKTIGFYNNKAKNIINMSKILIEEFHNQIPRSRESLMSLPGVGRKSANIILNIVFQQPTIAVDTHVFRVSNRLGLCQTKSPLDTEFALLEVMPPKWLSIAHHLLVLHGRYICKSRNPQCQNCTLNKVCKSSNNKFKN
jgi:endonuclease III